MTAVYNAVVHTLGGTIGQGAGWEQIFHVLGESILLNGDFWQVQEETFAMLCKSIYVVFMVFAKQWPEGLWQWAWLLLEMFWNQRLILVQIVRKGPFPANISYVPDCLLRSSKRCLECSEHWPIGVAFTHVGQTHRPCTFPPDKICASRFLSYCEKITVLRKKLGSTTFAIRVRSIWPDLSYHFCFVPTTRQRSSISIYSTIGKVVTNIIGRAAGAPSTGQQQSS